MEIKPFFDPATFTLTYVIHDPATKDAVIIDPVLDFDPPGVQTGVDSAKKLVEHVRALGLQVRWILETHAHADHLSASQWLKRELGAKVAIGRRITEVQDVFRGLFDLGPDFRADGSQFDRLLDDGEVLQAGSLAFRIIATPGHTPACVTYQLEDALFVGDALFIEDYGTGRCDFPRGSAEALYDSIQRLYALPDATRVFVGHDYQPGGRALRYETTIGASKAANIQLRGDTSREDYVRFRKTRDATLTPPRLLFPSVQVNITAGLLPPVRANGKRYLTFPMNVFRPSDDTGAPLP